MSAVRLSLLQGRLAGGARPDLAVLPALAAAPGRQLHGRAARPPLPAAAGHPGPAEGAGLHLPPPGAGGNPPARGHGAGEGRCGGGERGTGLDQPGESPSRKGKSAHSEL